MFIDKKLMHESRVFQLQVETTLDVCVPCIFLNATYVVTKKNSGINRIRTVNRKIPIIHGLFIDPRAHNDLLPVGLIAQLVKHCTGIAEVMV